ncbi:MAG TPA: hypothetical protein VK760_10815 [Candidatus Acidoferrales bacterium]|nr:hypothetical protein [Candidatus Acidoferrales bacterium]
MNVRTLFAVAAVALLAACSFQNKYEKEAQAITEAIAGNNLQPVQGDIAPRVKITRVQVAAMSDELGEAGKLVSLKETTTNCPPDTHCFDVKFEKRSYIEHMKLDENGKVVDWNYVPAPVQTN